jgi:hypothetical protein
MDTSDFFTQAVNQTLSWFEKQKGLLLIVSEMSSSTSPRLWRGEVGELGIDGATLYISSLIPSTSDRVSLKVKEKGMETRIVLSAYRESYGLPEHLTKGARPLGLEDQLTLGLWWSLTPEVLRGTNLYKSLRRRLQIHPDMLPNHLLTPAKIHFQIASDILNGISMGEG